VPRTEVVFFREEDGSAPALEAIQEFLRRGQLRVIHRRVHHRILYFFAGERMAVLSHLVTKEGRVPGPEIDRAVRRRALFSADPGRHTFRG